jgi:Kinesin motor domain
VKPVRVWDPSEVPPAEHVPPQLLERHGSLSRHVVSSPAHLVSLVNEAISMRAIAASERNANTSRSHVVFTLTLTQKMTSDDGTGPELVIGAVTFVDVGASDDLVTQFEALPPSLLFVFMNVVPWLLVRIACRLFVDVCAL